MYTHRQGGDLYDISLVVRKQTKKKHKVGRCYQTGGRSMYTLA